MTVSIKLSPVLEDIHKRLIFGEYQRLKALTELTLKQSNWIYIVENLLGINPITPEGYAWLVKSGYRSYWEQNQ